ncbi:MAG: AMIN domain-containing protein [Oscillospiraceae bacterium]|nr:AMIN domain-containing protein [Oscillospiraceae bacterium]
MKRLFSAFLAVLFALGLFPAALAAPAALKDVTLFSIDTGFYEPVSALPVQLLLDGAPLSSGVPALLYQNRTMVPVRPIAEALGAEVGWHQDNRQVTLTTKKHVIVLTIGLTSARVDGKMVPLPDGISAQLVHYQNQDSTMVPLRFVSEQLGCAVDWDGDSYTALVTRNPSPPPLETVPPTASPDVTPTITPALPPISPPPTNVPPPPPDEPDEPAPTNPVPEKPPAPSGPDEEDPSEEAAFTVRRIKADDNAQTVLVSVQGEGKVQYVVQEMDGRAVIDVLNARLRNEMPSTIYMENEIFSAVRYADHTELYSAPSVRVVLDLRPGYTCSANVEVTDTGDGILIRSFRKTDSTGTFLPTVPITPGASTVVLDAGHGGSANGALYEEIKEKTLNLAVTKKVAAILIKQGYNVIMTRSDDTYLGLNERANIANAIHADIFVSIHSNANENPEIYGLSTYHFPESRRGSLLAKAIQDAAAQASGAKNRGILSANFAVLRETEMPAALVEMGFMTNHDELMRLADSAYQDKMAQGIANGIVNYLNSQK